MASDITGNEENKSVDIIRCCNYEQEDFVSFIFSQASELLWTFCPPVIIVLGTFGNVMTIVIIRRMSEGRSSNSMFLYFTALAVSDLIILYFGLLRKWLIHIADIDFTVLHDVLCKLQEFLVNSCGPISAWLVVSMTIQRVASVVWPHHKNLSCSQRKVEIFIGVIVGLFTAFNYYRLYLFVIEIKMNSSVASCGYIFNDDLRYFDSFVYPWIDMAVSSLVPFVVLLAGNSVLVWKVIQSVQVARVMTAGGGEQVNSRQKKASSLTVTLITVSLAFLLLTAPVCAYIIFDPFVDIDTRSSALSFTWAVCNLSWYVNSAINFYLYFLSGARFRGEVKRLFCGVPLAKTKVPTTPVSMANDTGRFELNKKEEVLSNCDF